MKNQLIALTPNESQKLILFLVLLFHYLLIVLAPNDLVLYYLVLKFITCTKEGQMHQRQIHI